MEKRDLVALMAAILIAGSLNDDTNENQGLRMITAVERAIDILDITMVNVENMPLEKTQAWRRAV